VNRPQQNGQGASESTEGGCTQLAIRHDGEMQTLRFPFVKNGYQHDLLERVDDVCLVERINIYTGSVHWEVAILHQVPAKTLPSGRIRPAGEAYPSTSSWGRAGWTYIELPDARERFEALVRKAGFCKSLSHTALQPVEYDGITLGPA
jgi:hypothetical protein